MDVNVASMFLTCRAVVPAMREQGGGKIVNISSGTPFRGVPFLLHYVTSKGAIVALHARAREGARQGRDPRQLRRARLHDVRGRRGAAGGDRGAARRLGRRAHAPARPGARGRRRRRRLPLRPRRPTSSPARRWSSTAASTSIEALALRPPGRRRDDAPGTASSTTSGRRGAVRRRRRRGPRARLGARATTAPTGALLSAEVDLDPVDGWLHALRPRRLPAGRRRLPAHASRPGIRFCSSARSGSTPTASEHDYGPGEPGSRAAPTRCSRRRPRREDDGLRARAAAAARVGGQADDPLRRSRRRGEAEAPARDGLPRAADRSGEPHAAGRSSSTSSSCTASSSRSACPARATSRCSTRSTTRRSG